MKTYTLKETKHPDIFRVMDREGNWESYFVKSKNVYLRGVTTILNGGYAKGAFFDQWLSQHTADERDKILKAAGERGDKVHRAIDSILTSTEPLTITRELGIFNRETKDHERLENDEWDALLAFNSFWSQHGPQVIASESTLYNEAEGYAGTADALVILTKSCGNRYCNCKDLIGKIGLYDWKTSSGIRASYSAQIAAYANASNLREYLPKGRTLDYAAILRVGTNHKSTGGYEFKSFDDKDLSEAFVRFVGARNIYVHEHKPFDPLIDIQEIPDEIVFTVTQFDFKAAEAELLKQSAPLFAGVTPKVEETKKITDGKHSKGDGKARRRAKVAPRRKDHKAGR